ncbi:MAG: amylo-alpha-1,6-glucosidase [Bacteroidia bacterium]|nr:amylo-alpha-1,6-glucosidase [Bacteroidia bacterium]
MQQVGRVPLIESQWALRRELIRSTRWGGFAMTTLWGCPTRKYHAWLSLWKGFERWEILPQVQEELLLKEGHYLLTTQHFHGKLVWEGFRHLQAFQAGRAWTWEYQIGDLRIQKLFYLSPDSPFWFFRYRFSGPVLFRWIPLWAVRPWHTLRTEPLEVRRQGQILTFSAGLSLSFRADPAPRFVPWSYPYEGVYYPEEAARGYPATETLYASECWEWRLHTPGEIVIAFSPEEVPRIPLTLPAGKAPTTLYEALDQAAENFFLQDREGEYVLAGHPWFGVWGRDTFISLPGLTLARGEVERFHQIQETALRYLSPAGQLPTIFPDQYLAEDTGLWWVWSLLQAWRMGLPAQELWQRYGEALQAVLVGYLQRLAGADGLLYVSGEMPPSWMDAVVAGKPAVPRQGALVELNALWYAALRFIAEIAPQEGVRWRWDLLARQVLQAFKPTFWEKARGYLADWRSTHAISWQIRPNQLFAAALPYRPISEKIAELIVETVEKHLLTPRGLRTLSPADPAYQGRYEGPPEARDRAYHNGIVWPWLIGAYAEAKIAIWGSSTKPALQKLLQSFEEGLYTYGWGMVAEIYDGDAPHLPRGAPAQAWSIAELLRTHTLLQRL